MRRFVILAGFLLATVLSANAQDKPDPSNPRKVSGQVTITIVDKATVTKPVTTPTKPKASSGYIEKGTAQKPFLWKKPGGDPCNPKAGCTLGWALEKSGWPAEVQYLIAKKATMTTPALVTITKGWEGWMTWGKYSPKFELHTRAEFEQIIPTHEWSVAYEGTRYVLIRPHICKNWGGYTRPAEKLEVLMSPDAMPPVVNAPASEPTAPVVAGRPSLGPNPGLGGVVCVDDDPA